MTDEKENWTPHGDGDGDGGGGGGGALKMSLELHPQRIVRFGENENDIFMLRAEDTTRVQLVERLKADPLSPERWLELLKHPPSYDAKTFSKVRLFRRATTFIPKEKCRHLQSYVEIWILSAQLKENEKEARDTFKYMKSERIGERERMFYEHYAAFEYRNGNRLEAEEILSLGVRHGIYSTREREAMFQHMEQTHGDLHTPRNDKPAFDAWSLSTPSTANTSAASTAHGRHMGTSVTATTPNTLTPASSSASTHKRTTGFSTARKLPRSDAAALLSTPSVPTRSMNKSFSTSRKAHPSTVRLFNLGGPALRVIASASSSADEENDDDDDDEDEKEKSREIKDSTDGRHDDRDEHGDYGMGRTDKRKAMTAAEPLPTKLSPVFETSSVITPPGSGTAHRERPALPHSNLTARPVGSSSSASDLSYIKNWAPRSVMTSRAPSFDHPSSADLYPSPKRQQLLRNGGNANGNVNGGGVGAGQQPLSPISVSSMSSTSSPSKGGTVGEDGIPRDPFSSLTSKVVVSGRTYIKLEQIGSGGSSKVYRMLGPDLKIYALKKIKLKRLDPVSIEQYTNEIQLLKLLQGNPFIIRLIAAEQDLKQRAINVLMEHGEIDLSERLREMKDGMDENFLRVIWTQMLQAVHAIHRERIIHGDLKPANFLFVNGALKLIDFGIAKAISNDTTNIERDSQVGTVNFMSPEAIQGNQAPGANGRNPQGKMKVGRASDIWSLGCILYQVVYGKPPFADVHSIIDKFRCIIDPNYPIPFPSLKNKDLEDVIRRCLQREHRARPTIDGPDGLLAHNFLRNSSNRPRDEDITVTPANAGSVLSQMVVLLQTQGVDYRDVATFESIGHQALQQRGGDDTRDMRRATLIQNSPVYRRSPRRNRSGGAYKYDTEERRTDI